MRLYVNYAIYSASEILTVSETYVVRCRLRTMIKVEMDKLLRERGRSFYWLAKETGVSHTTLWRLKKDKAQGITFNTLRSICTALKCQPGDVLKLGKKKSQKAP